MLPASEPGKFAVVASLRNLGQAACPEFVVTFCAGDPKSTQPMIHRAGPLQPGQDWHEMSLPLALQEGVNQIYVTLDPAHLVDELDRTNDAVMLTVRIHDGQIIEQTTARVATLKETM